MIRENLIATLGELTRGEVVAFVETERDAIEWVRTHASQWDLAVIDIRLKQGTGINVLKEIAPLRGKGSIVVLTNYATAEVRKICLRLGADRVFDKSNELENFFDYVAAA